VWGAGAGTGMCLHACFASEVALDNEATTKKDQSSAFKMARKSRPSTALSNPQPPDRTAPTTHLHCQRVKRETPTKRQSTELKPA
jgi:hypothetical protein